MNIFCDLKTFTLYQPFPKRQILDSCKLKESADDNLNWHKVLQKGRKHWGKGEIAWYQQSLLSPVFSKNLYCRHIKTRACLGKSYITCNCIKSFSAILYGFTPIKVSNAESKSHQSAEFVLINLKGWGGWKAVYVWGEWAQNSCVYKIKL